MVYILCMHYLPDTYKQHILELVKQYGEAKTAKALGISGVTLIRCLSILPITRNVRLRVEKAVEDSDSTLFDFLTAASKGQ